MAATDFDKLQSLVSQHGVRMLELRYCDMVGAWHQITVPAAALGPALLTHGVAFDSSSIPGFKTVEGGDMVLVPDVATAALDLFCDLPSLAMICWIREVGSFEPFPRDPRHVACRAEQKLRELDIADESVWGPEFEYYVFDHVTSANTNNRSGYTVDTVEAHWNTGEEQERHLGTRIRYQGGYHVIQPLDALHDLRGQMVEHVQAAGIPVKYHHHEVGGAGQCEIEIEFLPMLRAADAVMTVKHIVRMTAHKAGRTATFMPKPLNDEAGSGMHFHQMLFRAGQPLFSDPAGYAGLSQTALHYIGGVLTHSPALLALASPSTNSFKRLVPGFEAPIKMFYGLANRSAAVRIPKQARSPSEKRFEFRPPDATCNPYLAMAAQLMAGIDGIRKKIDPSAAGFGPYDINVFKAPPEVRDRIRSLPTTLEAALQALEQDSDFLMAGDVFPADFVRTWVDYKLSREVLPVQTRIHPMEIELYYDL